MDRDELFYRFVQGLFAILLLYGAGMFIVILTSNTSIATKMIAGFASMFSGILGIGTGYLLGRRNGT